MKRLLRRLLRSAVRDIVHEELRATAYPERYRSPGRDRDRKNSRDLLVLLVDEQFATVEGAERDASLV
jgi:hypothetical protein